MTHRSSTKTVPRSEGRWGWRVGIKDKRENEGRYKVCDKICELDLVGCLFKFSCFLF